MAGCGWARTSRRRRCPAASPRADRAEDRYPEEGPSFLLFVAFAAFLRLSDVWAPNFFVNRSTRPSVSSSFCRPVKNGGQFEQISRCSSGLVDLVCQVAPHAQRASTLWYLGWMFSFTATPCLLQGNSDYTQAYLWTLGWSGGVPRPAPPRLERARTAVPRTIAAERRRRAHVPGC